MQNKRDQGSIMAAKPKPTIVKGKKGHWSKEEEGSLLRLYETHGKKVAKVVYDMAVLGYHRSAQACRVRYRKLVGPETGVVGRHCGHQPRSKKWSNVAENTRAIQLRAKYDGEKGRDGKVAKDLNDEFHEGESVRSSNSVRNHFLKIKKRKAAVEAGKAERKCRTDGAVGLMAEHNAAIGAAIHQAPDAAPAGGAPDPAATPDPTIHQVFGVAVGDDERPPVAPFSQGLTALPGISALGDHLPDLGSPDSQSYNQSWLDGYDGADAVLGLD